MPEEGGGGGGDGGQPPGEIELPDAAGMLTGIMLSPRHRVQFNSSNEGSKVYMMTWKAARHVIGCSLT